MPFADIQASLTEENLDPVCVAMSLGWGIRSFLSWLVETDHTEEICMDELGLGYAFGQYALRNGLRSGMDEAYDGEDVWRRN